MSKKKSHKKALVVLGIIAGIILIFCIVFRRQIKLGIEFFERADFAHQDTGYTAVSIELTAEQRLRDFDYMYDLVCLQYPGKEYIEEQFGISY